MLYHLTYSKLYLLGAHQGSPDLGIAITLGDKEKNDICDKWGQESNTFLLTQPFPQETNYEFQTEVY